jgi:hypothetical protein
MYRHLDDLGLADGVVDVDDTEDPGVAPKVSPGTVCR